MRTRHASGSLRLHRSLLELAKRHDRCRLGRLSSAPEPRTPPQRVWRALPAVPDTASRPNGLELFAAAVAARLDGSLLPYSDRLALIKIAHRMGIGRFEANLCIAAVQHRRHPESRDVTAPPSRLRLPIAAIAIASAIEAAMAAGVWYFMR